MERLELYNHYVQQLLDDGQAYYARETSEELDAMRELANAAKKPFHYSQIAYTDAQIEQFTSE